MYKTLEITICVLLFFSCTGKSDKEKSNNSSDITSLMKPEEKFDTESLISFKSEFVMEDGSEADGYYEDRNLFIVPYTSYSYNQDTLRVSTLHEVNSCGETAGRISYSNDSIFLQVEQIGEEACTSIEFRKFHYLIEKKNIKKYVIVF